MDPSEYTRTLGYALNDLRKQNQLCDVTINIGGRAFHVHKAVLAACSSYFMAMFTSGFSESTQSEINIDGKADIFEMLVEFTYTGRMEITPETAYDILEMALYMQIIELRLTCTAYIECCYYAHDPCRCGLSESDETILVGDVFKIAKLADCHDHLKHLSQKSENYLYRNFKLLKCSDVFLQLANENFISILLTKQQFPPSKEDEKEVLEMVVNWLKYDWSSRGTYALELLQKVRLGCVPGETLRNLLDAAILEIPECRQLAEEVFRLQTSNHSPVTLARDFPNLFTPRSTVKVPFILSSHDVGIPCMFYYYDWNTKRWTGLSKFKSLPHLASLIVVNECLYAVGGVRASYEARGGSESDDDDDDGVNDDDGYNNFVWRVCVNDILCYDAEKNEWERLPSSMKKARHSLLLVHMDGFIYAISGSDTKRCYDSRYVDRHENAVERYDMEKKEWQDVASLPEGFRWTSAVVFQGNLLVYGVEVQGKHKHVMVIYNSNTGVWVSKHSEHSCRWRPLLSPALFMHRDVCYRVMYRHKAPYTVTASVDVLKFARSRRNRTIQVGESIPQDHIPNNKIGAFRIHDEVFMNIHGYIYKTDVKISADQCTKVNLDKWSGRIINTYKISNGVSLSMDIDKLSTYIGRSVPSCLDY